MDGLSAALPAGASAVQPCVTMHNEAGRGAAGVGTGPHPRLHMHAPGQLQLECPRTVSQAWDHCKKVRQL